MPKAQREAALLLADIDKAVGRIRLYITGMDAEAFEASFCHFRRNRDEPSGHLRKLVSMAIRISIPM